MRPFVHGLYLVGYQSVLLISLSAATAFQSSMVLPKNKMRAFVGDSKFAGTPALEEHPDYESVFFMDEELSNSEASLPAGWMTQGLGSLKRPPVLNTRAQVEPSSGYWSDLDLDWEQGLQRLSYTSDPESVEGLGTRGLSPSLTTTLQVYDAQARLVPPSSPPVEYSRIFHGESGLLKSDLERIRQLSLRNPKTERPHGRQTQARSLPSSTIFHGAASENLRGPVQLAGSRDIPTFLPSSVHRRSVASALKGYLSDGDS
jgi:hypothetical protein